MADTNIRLLSRKIEALDPEAQRAVEIAVDSLLDDAGLTPNTVGDGRIAARERRVGTFGDQNDSDDVVLLYEYDCDVPELQSAIEHLIEAAQQALRVIAPANATPEAL